MSAVVADPVVAVRRVIPPSPPTDEELYAYFGPQRRWVVAGVSLAYGMTAVTLLLFSLRHPALWPFLAVLVLNVVAWLVSLVDGLRVRRVTRPSHELLLRAWHPERPPSVDVFLPTCGEPLEVLENAYRHVAGVRWAGRLAVWVLDDADRPEVGELAGRYGLRYLVRPDRGRLKKAGNLNYALSLSEAEVVAVLDADFCPRGDFLHHLVPYLADSSVAIVQSPQVFDTTADMNWLQRGAGAAQEWFFRWLQPSRDANGATVCCGSNAVYRRSALEEIGGFARMPHSEDLFTGLALDERGHRTMYVPVQVAKGLSPDTLPAFINQQYRWAIGNLLLVRGHRMAAMSWRQRVSYWNGILGYMLAAVNVFAAALPPLIMMVFYPGEIRAWHVLALLAPLWVWLVLLPSVSRTRWRTEVIRCHVMISMAAGVALWHTLRGRDAGWVPTGAATGAARRSSALAHRVCLTTTGWLVVSTGALWAGTVAAVARYGWRDHWGLVLYTLVMSYLAVPLIRDLLRDLRGRPPVASRRGPGELAWPELLAMSAALALTGLVASGHVDSMLF